MGDRWTSHGNFQASQTKRSAANDNPSKLKERAEVEAATAAYLARGGTITQCPECTAAPSSIEERLGGMKTYSR